MFTTHYLICLHYKNSMASSLHFLTDNYFKAAIALKIWQYDTWTGYRSIAFKRVFVKVNQEMNNDFEISWWNEPKSYLELMQTSDNKVKTELFLQRKFNLTMQILTHQKIVRIFFLSCSLTRLTKSTKKIC